MGTLNMTTFNPVTTNTTQPENTMTTTNATPFDLNAILGAAVLQVVTQATATLAARVDELEQIASRQQDSIAALLRGLNRVEDIVDGTDAEAAHVGALEARVNQLVLRATDDSLERRVGVIERTLYACVESSDERAVPGALMQYVQEAIDTTVSAAMAAHADAYDHDDFGPAIDEYELDQHIDRAIAQHERDTDHLDEGDVEKAIDTALEEHATQYAHKDADDIEAAVRAALSSIGSISARVVFE